MSQLFDKLKLTVREFDQSERLVTLDDIKDTDFKGYADREGSKSLEELAGRIRFAREGDQCSVKPVILFLGGHVIKGGYQRFIIDWIQRGLVSHIACNGAVAIHDYELAVHGRTSEPVERYLPEGMFGLWNSMTEFNQSVRLNKEKGIGEALGSGKLFVAPYKGDSVIGMAQVYQVPVTVHPLIGGDINIMHPDYDAAAFGEAAHVDFLKFAEAVRQLEYGAFLNMGSAVHGPEVFLKALSMARNVQAGRPACFTTAVFDLNESPARSWALRQPDSSEPDYYWRPGKTLLSRATHAHGRSLFIGGDFKFTIPHLHHYLRTAKDG